MTGILNLPNIGTGIGLYAAYKTGTRAPAHYLGYGAAGYAAGWLALRYTGPKESTYSGYGSYGTSCARTPAVGTAAHDAAWLRKIGYEAGCERGQPGYEHCATSALMRWTPASQARIDAAKAKKAGTTGTGMWAPIYQTIGMYSCPTVSAPSAERVAWLRSTRAAPALPVRATTRSGDLLERFLYTPFADQPDSAMGMYALLSTCISGAWSTTPSMHHDVVEACGGLQGMGITTPTLVRMRQDLLSGLPAFSEATVSSALVDAGRADPTDADSAMSIPTASLEEAGRDREKLIIAGVVGVSLLLLAMR